MALTWKKKKNPSLWSDCDKVILENISIENTLTQSLSLSYLKQNGLLFFWGKEWKLNCEHVMLYLCKVIQILNFH